MKQFITIMLIMVSAIVAYSQNNEEIKERLDDQSGKINALDERLMTAESDLSKLTKIKVTGYIQAQFEDYQTDLVKTNDAFNTFYIRRARVKFTYEALDGVKFVLQPDFSTGNLSLKDAYAIVNDPWLKIFQLWAGQFNRPNYEVEYSSTSREVLERSRLIRTIYPGEREVGAKLEMAPKNIPFKLQAAILNGNFTGSQQKDIDTKKDLMFRAVYSINLRDAGIGIDLGAHTYMGGLRAKVKYTNNFDGVLDSVTTGDYHDKKWFGAEMQAYIDILGGMSLKGEYITGKNAFVGDSKTNPYKLREFSGYYLYFVKNIGKKHQAVVKYDYFDPNTKLKGDEVGSSADLSYNTLTFAWQYYFDDNIRISLNYEMPKNEKSAKAKIEKDLKDNVFGIRIQAKF